MYFKPHSHGNNQRKNHITPEAQNFNRAKEKSPALQIGNRHFTHC